MKHYLLALAAAAWAVSMSGAAFANHHDQGHDGHQMKKMEDGMMECCMTDQDGKKVCRMMDHSKMDHSKMSHGKMDHSKMDHSKMDHSKMDHSKMDHGNMAQPAAPAAKPN